MLLNNAKRHIAELKEMRGTNSFCCGSRNQSSLYFAEIIEPRIAHVSQIRCLQIQVKRKANSKEEEKVI